MILITQPQLASAATHIITTSFKAKATLNAVNLFHPRHQVWNDHFIWSNDGCRIIGITETGRATVNRLDLNDEVRSEAEIVRARQAWVRVGWHPPSTDSRKSFQLFVIKLIKRSLICESMDILGDRFLTKIQGRSLFDVVGLLRGDRLCGGNMDV